MIPLTPGVVVLGSHILSSLWLMYENGQKGKTDTAEADDGRLDAGLSSVSVIY